MKLSCCVFFVLLMFFLPLSKTFSQQSGSVKISHLHMYGIGPRAAVWRYKFTVNGTPLILRPGHCMEYSVTADSVIIEITNKIVPRFKNQVPINLSVPAKEDLYVYFNSSERIEKFPYSTLAVKEMCKECYDKLLGKCK